MAHPTGSLRYGCQDETRLGLKTIQRRQITAKGVKPMGQVQCGTFGKNYSPRKVPWQREAFYLYGLVEPKPGESFFYEFSHLDGACFEVFLKLVSEQFPESLNVIQLDNASAHTAKQLQIPDNVLLVFQPPHSPELNLIERLWQQLKSKMAWVNFENLDQLRHSLAEQLQKLEASTIASLTGWDYILNALSVAGIS